MDLVDLSAWTCLAVVRHKKVNVGGVRYLGDGQRLELGRRLDLAAGEDGGSVLVHRIVVAAVLGGVL